MKVMTPKHKQWSATYASIFGDASVVQAYQHRPPYPPQTFEILEGLISGMAPRTVLDAAMEAPNLLVGDIRMFFRRFC
jgi:hypothetical protein